MNLLHVLLFSTLILLNVALSADISSKNQMTLEFSQNMTQASTLQVTKILPWGDCDMPKGKTFHLSDDSKWYTMGLNSLAFHISEEQFIIVIPMTDEEALQYQDPFQVFPSRGFWVIFHNKDLVLKVMHAYRMNQ